MAPTAAADVMSSIVAQKDPGPHVEVLERLPADLGLSAWEGACFLYVPDMGGHAMGFKAPLRLRGLSESIPWLWDATGKAARCMNGPSYAGRPVLRMSVRWPRCCFSASPNRP